MSAGIATAIAPEHLEPLLHRADSALYAAKRGGRNRAVLNTLADASLLPELPVA